MRVIFRVAGLALVAFGLDLDLIHFLAVVVGLVVAFNIEGILDNIGSDRRQQ